ncbi:hypothetical protein E2C01_063814 [Portunus trituberculatus]|uniref:Uncharacterized protein n=1 Tax=Portunus trituberculatus TaxID=210409 RepID=A0A5B7HM24_PORTR|nr:hypothetical protein [Portunus trituberculatus]
MILRYATNGVNSEPNDLAKCRSGLGRSSVCKANSVNLATCRPQVCRLCWSTKAATHQPTLSRKAPTQSPTQPASQPGWHPLTHPPTHPARQEPTHPPTPNPPTQAASQSGRQPPTHLNRRLQQGVMNARHNRFVESGVFLCLDEFQTCASKIS